MNIRDRAMVLTGMAFPLGSVFGVVFARATVPPSTGGGFGDIIYILLWFVLGAPLLTALTYFWSTRKIEWTRTEARRALFTMVQGIFAATTALVLMLVLLGRSGNVATPLMLLPVSALIVTWFARKALKA